MWACGDQVFFRSPVKVERLKPRTEARLGKHGALLWFLGASVGEEEESCC